MKLGTTDILDCKIGTTQIESVYLGTNLVWSNTAPALILDTYTGSTLAMSVYLLSVAYAGNCLRVRRSSDNTTLDIGFVGGLLDTTSILAFVGGGNGFVDRWYYQDGSGVYASQTSNSLQPQIVASGSLITVNGLVTLNFDGKYMTIPTITLSSTWSVFSIGKKFISSNGFIPISGDVSFPSCVMHFTDANYYIIRQGNYDISNSTDTNTNQMLLTGIAKSGSQDIYRDGTIIPSTGASLTINNTFNQIGRYVSTIGASFISEILFWDFDQDSNRVGIETDMKSRFTSIP